MILIVSTCSDKLSEAEFVEPVLAIVSGKRLDERVSMAAFDSISDKERISALAQSAERIIICGTALKDFEYLAVDWSWLCNVRVPVLGICAGAHAIAKSCRVSLSEDLAIGPCLVKVLKENPLLSSDSSAYFLHQKSVDNSDEMFISLAFREGRACLLKRKDLPHYLCLFHPEVLNPDIVENFLKL